MIDNLIVLMVLVAYGAILVLRPVAPRRELDWKTMPMGCEYEQNTQVDAEYTGIP